MFGIRIVPAQPASCLQEHIIPETSALRETTARTLTDTRLPHCLARWIGMADMLEGH